MIPIWILDGNDPFRLDYLLVGGGGGGNDVAGGGGGAGGYLCSMPGEQSGGPSAGLEQIIYFGGESIAIQVGNGGSPSSNGGDSIFGDLTALGGGHGGYYRYSPEAYTAPAVGGSGGGGPSAPSTGILPGAIGTTNQGNAGSTGARGLNLPATFRAGCGGGAGEDAEIDKGGDGIASSITGVSVYRGGGGGGSRGFSTPFFPGGLGGGGNGQQGDARNSPQVNPTAGTINTGGGGGGGGANGGSGVVILRYPSYRRDIANIDVGLSYTKTVDGGFTIYTFTAGTGDITF